MARKVDNINHVAKEVKVLVRTRDLFAFLLFDDRPSHQAVAQFAEQQFEWLDQLAHSTQMIFFIFIRQKKGKTSNYARVTLAKEEIQNPSLELASKFGIKPSQMPGIILFTSLSLDGTNTGVYLPIKATMFKGDFLEAEKVFVDLFSLIHECRQNAGNPEQLLSNLRKKVAFLKRSGQVRPALSYLKGGLLALITFSETLAEVMAKTFVEESVKRLA